MATLTLERPQQRAAPFKLSRSTWPHRLVAIVVIAIGGVLVGWTLAVNLLKVGPAFETMMGDFRPALTQQAIATDQQDIAALSAVNTEFSTKLAPTLAQQLGMTQAQFSAFLTTNYPAVAAGTQALPRAVPTFSSLIATLDKQRPLFASADAIPTTNLPATTVPWGLLAVGLVTIGLGGYLWARPRSGSVLVMALAAAMLIVPLALSLPQKAADADQLNANLKPVYTQQMVDQAKATLVTLSAMGSQMQTSMLPALAAQLKMQPAQLQTFMTTNFPATAGALQSMPATVNRFGNLVNIFEKNLGHYRTLKPVAFVPIVWLLIGSGIALFLIGAPIGYREFKRV